MDDRPVQFTTTSSKWRELKQIARDMRQQPTKAENHLWQYLRNRQINGARFRRQHSIGSFVVDFVCISQRLIIEVDGSIHDLEEQQSYDMQRQSFLEEQGFRVIRFTNDQILQDIQLVIESIANDLKA